MNYIPLDRMLSKDSTEFSVLRLFSSVLNKCARYGRKKISFLGSVKHQL